MSPRILLKKSPAAVLAAAAILSLTLSGCSMMQQLSDITEGKEDVFSLTLGHCFDDGDLNADEVTSVKMPECTETHDNEVYHLYDVSDADFAEYDADALMSEADLSCLPEFEDFVGTSELDTSLYYSYFVPGADSWADGDREILCFAYDTNGPIDEPLGGKGADYPLS
ncbi:putative regulator of septum formation [Homoserinimonas aerilata]|uniref:Putative regulator of septum formation n=1 Tax=Homoserinimonas aerilata TaxID=1162970 RepID=A0A542YKG1_9MICO|nr:septum formation family protein [Homoserinimonas aerilata]TQL48575.1 putative regulator of septum formation [Homoserinimonas aerilata]